MRWPTDSSFLNPHAEYALGFPTFHYAYRSGSETGGFTRIEPI